ncbi:hypothetical protein Dimus_009672 [Dionaea muscipula]
MERLPSKRKISHLNPDDYPDFFKIYMPEINSIRLRIPPAFINNFNGNVPKHVIVKNSAGKFWHMELERVEGNYFLSKGWKLFVSDYSLERGEFLVFGYNGNSVFGVKVFGKDGCKKAEPPAKTKRVNFTCANVKQEFVAEEIQVKQTGTGRQAPPDTHGSPEKSVRFVKTFSAGQASFLHIPSGVVSEYSIKAPAAIFLRNQNGVVKSAATLSRRKDGRIAVTCGWKDFCIRSNILPGDECEFEILFGPVGRRVEEICVCVSKKKPAKPALSWETTSE